MPCWSLCALRVQRSSRVNVRGSGSNGRIGGAVSDRAPYSRVYWSVMEDAKFDGIRDDPRLFGTWSLLLIAADMAHPAPAYILPTVSRSCVVKLVDKGLIDLLDGHRYRIHGLDAERQRRRDAATTRVPDGTQTVPRRGLNGEQAEAVAETRTSRGKDESDARVDLEAFLIIKRRAPTPRQRQLLDDVMERHDLTGPAWAADIMYRNPDDPIGAVIEADKGWRAERIAAAQAAERPKPVPRRPRGLPTSTRELLQEWSASAKLDDGA